MSQTAAIYIITHDLFTSSSVRLALDALRAQIDQLFVVVPKGARREAAEALDACDYDRMIESDIEAHSYLNGIRLGLQALRPAIENYQSVIVTGSGVFGPLFGVPEAALNPGAAGAALFAPYWFDPQLGNTASTIGFSGRLPMLDFTAFDRSILNEGWFWDWVEGLRPESSGQEDYRRGAVALAKLLRQHDLNIHYPVADTFFETADPRTSEVHKVVEGRCPVIPVAVFQIEPVMHDLNAIYLRRALDLLHEASPEFYRAIMRFNLRRLPLREFATIAEEYEVIPETARSPGKTEWSFGKIAIFIHAFYANMMPQFWELLQRMPGEYDLFITTASSTDKAAIEAFLDARGLPASRRDVRVVEQNRGRDMSSLFITFRDVILADRYQVALRLHSKRTPQVSRQVGESFKDHLFENLVASPDHVRNILDMMETHPEIGLVIPPVIHIGFGTLGHSWFDNRTALVELLEDMHIKVPLDHHTPVAPYGTMYWFRPEALKVMFSWNWKWEDYNAEPNHTDGGLAHVQERLIGYVAQAKGYRIVSVLTPRNAARGYAKLEYKLALLASMLASGNIYHQREELRAKMGAKWRRSLYHVLGMRYSRFLANNPGARRFISPIVRPIGALLRR